MKAMKILLSMLVLTMIAGCSLTASGENESSAKKTVDTYLKFMKNGKVDEAEEYLDTSSNLIDVFSYKFLETISEEEHYDYIYLSRHDYNSDEKWGEVKENALKEYADKEKYKIRETTEFPIGLTIYDLNKPYKEYELLYDMEIANEAGNKLYKKIEFTVSWNLDEERFYITYIDIR